MSTKEARKVLSDAYLAFYGHYKKDLGLSQKDLAEVIGTTPSYVNRLVNGQEDNAAARKNLLKLFKHTGYTGEFWLD